MRVFDFAVIDTEREKRTGFPEAVFCSGKTVEQSFAIISRMVEAGIPVLATKAQAELAARVGAAFAGAKYDELSRTLTIKPSASAPPPCPPPACGGGQGGGAEAEGAGLIAVVTAGTSDLPCALEALRTAEFLGSRVKLFADVGVAGIHRLFENLDEIRKARVIIACAGMEGALASVIAGLVSAPVIALPTSIGYGASFGGLSALLGMLNCCAPGVSVVNIDNGYGAGYQAHLINTIGA